MTPFFSICIPAYKNANYLRRLLQSVAAQECKDYEVVITDDSPDDSVQQLVQTEFAELGCRYFKHTEAAGTPANWNRAMDHAKGRWIKLMHDDDWFAHPKALSVFMEAASKATASGIQIIGTHYTNVLLDAGMQEQPRIQGGSWRWKHMQRHPQALYARNIIGPPSVVLVAASLQLQYDERMKWLVDIDYYIRAMAHSSILVIPEVLVKVGLGSSQVTQYTHNRPDVEIPEGLLLWQKLGNRAFKSVLYYDAWWRLLRNLHITRANDLLQWLPEGADRPQVQLTQLAHQTLAPAFWRKNGVLSKIFMLFSWISQYIAGSFK